MTLGRLRKRLHATENSLSEAEQKSQRDGQPDEDRTALERELRQAVDGDVRFDETTQAVYSTDASNYRQVPLGVVIPRTVEAIEQAIHVCHLTACP
jgi:FAD/FMN-containing dehydrogenase